MDEIKTWKEPLITIEALFKALPSFKKWIEGTVLFEALKKDANKGRELGISPALEVHEPDGSTTRYTLNGNTVDKAEDLPVEIIYKFYINSPFYKSNTNNNLKQIENAD